MPEKVLLSIDLGTTGIKVGLVDGSGKVLGAASRECSIQCPKPGLAEQDPGEWWLRFIECCRSLQEAHAADFKRIEGVGICGQMHTQVCLDAGRQVLRPAITWMDQRSSPIVSSINASSREKALVFQETQNVAAATYTAPQLRWIRENEPQVWSRTRHVLVAKDFLKYLLTGELATDFSDASGTLLFDGVRQAWSPAMLELFGIPRGFLPELLPSDQIVGAVSPEASRLTGIKAGTPVANGCADCSAAALGAGMVSPGQVTLIIGTAGVLSVCSDRALPDRLDRTLCWSYCLRDRWVNLGVMQTSGESLQWFRNAFEGGQQGKAAAEGDLFEEYNDAIGPVPDGSEGVIFLPYLSGERTPYWDSFARGVFFGLHLGVGKAHFIKAIMEGVSFSFRHCLQTIESLGIRVQQIQAVGGGLKSEAWLNILGKILRRPIRTVANPDTGLVGNMLLAGRALGWSASAAEEASRVVRYAREIHFPEGLPVYERQYQSYLGLYQDLKERFRAAAAQDPASAARRVSI
jgi:xylulokinase